MKIKEFMKKVRTVSYFSGFGQVDSYEALKKYDYDVSKSIKYLLYETEYGKDMVRRKRRVRKCKQLRRRTGAGMVRCKKALQETDWNVDKAEIWLRENNIEWTRYIYIN